MSQRYQDSLLFLLLLAIAAGAMVLYFQDRGDGAELEVLLPTPVASITVYVTGAVVAEGVYTLPNDARWQDAVGVAGGLTANANRQDINLAARVRDGEHVHVPIIGEGPSGVASSQGGLVGINGASAALLDTLNGIGEARAKSIVDSREKAGPFTSTEDLVTRGLIPDSVYQAIKDKLTLR